MKRLLVYAIALLVFAAALLAEPLAAHKTQTTEVPLALKGLDPVMLVAGKEVKGDSTLSVTRGLFRYFFSSAENKAKFEKQPKEYEIQLGGTCPVVPGAEGDPELFAVYKDRIYIFATPGCLDSFKATPEQFVGSK
jgi:YHS domain-containing protein